MINDLKKQVLVQAGKLMSSPATMKLLTNPNVQKAMVKFFTVRSSLKNQWNTQLKSTLKIFNIVSIDDLNRMKRDVQTLQAKVEKLKKQAEAAEKARDEAEKVAVAATEAADEKKSVKKSSTKK